MLPKQSKSNCYVLNHEIQNATLPLNITESIHSSWKWTGKLYSYMVGGVATIQTS